MKKFVSVFALAAFMACGAAKAQFVGTGAENNGNANEVDSLRTVVGTLSKQVDKCQPGRVGPEDLERPCQVLQYRLCKTESDF